MSGPTRRPIRILVLADDLIWSTRLSGLVRSAGGEPHVVATRAAFDAALIKADRVIVDLTARTYDGLTAVGHAAGSGRDVICVGRHDDRELRRRARAAGASHVYAYRGLYEGGPGVIAGWLGQADAAEPQSTDERTPTAR